MRRSLPFLLTAVLVLPAACGGDEEPEITDPTELGGAGCAALQLPGHRATRIRAERIVCAEAERVIAGAVGQGRQAYEVAGFSCRPSQAGGGDTNYDCTGEGGARISFRYGAA